MSRWRCNTCDGEYEALQATREFYWHACAPVHNAVTGELEPRPQSRDENPRVGPHGQYTGITRPGTGRTRIRMGPPPGADIPPATPEPPEQP
jgi:hypothetical protein